MPTYDYMCENCGHEFEQFQTITAGPLRKCPNCGKAALKRLIGVGAGIIFRGSGFYETDYRSESYKKAAEREKKSSADKEKSPTSKDTEKNVTTAESKETKSSEKIEPGKREKKKSG
jgi:putative FmdB family regulatory protein